MKKTVILLFLLMLTGQTMTQWVNNYWGNNLGDDNKILNSKGLAVTTDSHKDCYVTGYTTDPNTGSDIILIKYDEEGDTIYSRTYSGTGVGEDRAFGIAVDDLDNIYITGQVSMAGRGLELVVLKYSSNGNLLWDKIYGATSQDLDDAGLSLVIDDNNKVIVTGYCTGADGLKDIVTIKLNQNGSTAWVKMEDGEGGLNSEGFGIAVDDNDFIYVSGYTTSENNSSGKDVAVIKYGQGGNKKWLKSYNGSVNKDDIAYGIALDGYNKIYLTGYTTVGSADDNTDVLLMKLNSNGSINWVKKYNEGNGISTDKAFGIIVDSDNRIYVSGETSTSINNRDYLVLKYNLSGVLHWSTKYDGPVHGDDYASAISILSSSKIVVTGASWGTNQNYDYATVKIKKSNGEKDPASRYSVAVSSNDIAKDVDVSSNNTIYVTGYSELIVENKGSGTAISTIMERDDDGEMNTGNNVPEKFRLFQNYPNPFNPSTTIKFEISDNMPVKLVVYDMLGRSVDILVNSELKAGSYSITYTNKNLSSGIYFYELSAGNYKDVKKMNVVK